MGLPAEVCSLATGAVYFRCCSLPNGKLLQRLLCWLQMLYDNPQLASTLLAAFALTGDQRFAHTARNVLDYLRRDMTHPGGGLFSAEVMLCSVPASAGHS